MTHARWQDVLQPDERLLWEGSPLPGLHGWPRLVGLTLIGLPFLIAGAAMLVFGLRQVFVTGRLGDIGLGVFLTVFALPFLGIGLVLVIGQWVEAAQAHRRLRYALSNRAAYVAREGWRRTLHCYPILPQTAIELETGRGGDTLWFHSRTERDSDGTSTTKVGFENIADGASLFRLIRAAQTGEAP